MFLYVLRGARGWMVAAAVVAVGLSACGSLVTMEAETPGGPRISGLEFLTEEPQAGCPLSIKVHLETGTAEEVHVAVGWTRLDRRAHDSRRELFPATPTPTGDVVVQIVPERRGAYSYQVQIDDAGGRWSNVLRARLSVDAPARAESSRCS